MYASVTWKSYGRITTWSDSTHTFTYPDDLTITDVYKCEYEDMEDNANTNLMGAILFYGSMRILIQIQMWIRMKGDIVYSLRLSIINQLLNVLYLYCGQTVHGAINLLMINGLE